MRLAGERMRRYLGKACFAASFASALVPTAIAIPSVVWNPSQPDPGLYVLTALYSISIGIPLALLHALLLGLPAYLLLSRRWRFRWWHGLVGGALVAALPIGSMIVWSELAAHSNAADIAGIARVLLYLGLCGAVGGFVFWRKMRPDEAIAA
ncbi:MAG: hypothetical protein EOP59_07320 [Sphingomonadales bacterium]|nr:MAG: hypothetical protein EOP59_07320 [Sphingomonadales bacterium]